MNLDKSYKFGKYLEEFLVGDTFKHWPGKTITESDNNLFCLLTMNHHPVHLDKEYAKQAQHGKILVVGTYVFSLVVGMTVRDISGKAIANLGFEDVNHLYPVFIGDTIYAESEVLAVRPSRSKPDRGIIKINTIGYNQDHKKVLQFKRSVLIQRSSVEAS